MKSSYYEIVQEGQSNVVLLRKFYICTAFLIRLIPAPSLAE
jgi:hypothetical protein